MRLKKALLCLSTYVSFAFADVSFQTPGAGLQYPGGTALTVTWIDSGIAPSISDLTSYELALYTGSNSSPVRLYTLNPGTVGTLSATVTIPVGIGGNTVNAYFLQMTSKKAAGGSVINYSSRFTLTGMQGTFTQDVINTLTTVSGTAGPPTVLQAVARAAASEDNFAIPYNQQTGQIKYAPMQPLPPHTITAQNTSPLWPTSSVVIATTPLPIPTVTFTYTQPGTWVFTSHENTAAAQSQPTGDMQKFLNRWKD